MPSLPEHFSLDLNTNYPVTLPFLPGQHLSQERQMEECLVTPLESQMRIRAQPQGF